MVNSYKICEGCEGEYKTSDHRQRFCCDLCRRSFEIKRSNAHFISKPTKKKKRKIDYHKMVEDPANIKTGPRRDLPNR